ncbi:MAG: PQQ-dependent sugar dehydrogenase [Candidatus Latescibacterota bacterium]|nr:MAG: PQQ-dependent sugar dehydrogenase [Candidatus Latescibacterota bacterium]
MSKRVRILRNVAMFLHATIVSTAAFGQSLLDPALEVETVVSGLTQPTALAILPTGEGTPREMLVCEKATGRVQHVRGADIVGTALDLHVNSRSERGLLGMALHPEFASNGWVYLYYTASNTGGDSFDQNAVQSHRVERYAWDGSSLGSPTPILELPALPGPNHDGGVILFLPDGKLYGVIGDLNRNGQLQNFATGPVPDDTGIIFRLNDDGSEPTDNPFFTLGGLMAKVYAYGVRNSFGLDFDPVTGALWDTENGPRTFDEINRVVPGFNSGWERIMGPVARDSEGTSDLWQAPGAQYGDPLFSWRATIGVTSIHFIRGDVLGPTLAHRVLVGDNNNGSLYLFEPSGDRATLVMPTPETEDRVADSTAERTLFLFGTGFGIVTDIESGADGVYVCSIGGNVYRIHGASTSVQPSPWGDVKRLYRSRPRR